MNALILTIALIAALVAIWKLTRPFLVTLNNRSVMMLDNLGLNAEQVEWRIRYVYRINQDGSEMGPPEPLTFKPLSSTGESRSQLWLGPPDTTTFMLISSTGEILDSLTVERDTC